MSATANLPTGRRGRILAIALVVVLLLVLWLGLVAPLAAFYGDRAEELAKRQVFASHMAGLVEQLPVLRQRAENAAHAGPQPTLVFEGLTDALAAAALQSRVRDMAGSTGTNLVSVEILPGEALGAYRRIGLKISLNATWPVLIALLQSVEQASPPMLVDDVQIHGSPLPMLNNNRGLEANFTVYALRSGSAGDRKP